MDQHNIELRNKLKTGNRTCGAFLQLNNHISAEILGQAGFDWLIVDLEHAPVDYATLVQQFQAIAAGGHSIPFARTPSADSAIVKRILDAGSKGVLIPYINTREQAEAAVAACLFPPEGIRGAAKSPRAANYGHPQDGYFEASNQSVNIVLAIETKEAISNLDDILKIDRIDGIFIGPMDLAVSLGCNTPEAPEVKAAIAEIEQKVLASSKYLGTICTNAEKSRELYQRGYQWLILMQDGCTLSDIARSTVAEFHRDN